MIKRELVKLTAGLDLNPPPSGEDLKSLLQKVDFEIDQDYIAFIRDHDGASGSMNDSSYILLWKASEVVQLNPYYEGVEECDKLLFIGSDGGSKGYAFDKVSGKIVGIDFLDIAYSEPAILSDSFFGFMEKLANKSNNTEL